MKGKCSKCRYEWDTKAKRPQCPRCKSIPRCKSMNVKLEESIEERILYEMRRLNKKADKIIMMLEG